MVHVGCGPRKLQGAPCISFLFWPHPTACGILVPQPGTEPTPTSLDGWSLNHWTIREVPHILIYVNGTLFSFAVCSLPNCIQLTLVLAVFLSSLIQKKILNAHSPRGVSDWWPKTRFSDFSHLLIAEPTDQLPPAEDLRARGLSRPDGGDHGGLLLAP